MDLIPTAYYGNLLGRHFVMGVSNSYCSNNKNVLSNTDPYDDITRNKTSSFWKLSNVKPIFEKSARRLICLTYQKGIAMAADPSSLFDAKTGTIFKDLHFSSYLLSIFSPNAPQ